MNLDLLTPAVEIGLVTTNLDAMVEFYEGFLGLELQGEIEFDDGSQRRYTLGGSVIKLVTYTTPPPLPPAPGGGRAQAGLRYFTIGIQNLRDAAARIEAAGYDDRRAAHRVRSGTRDGLDVHRRSRRQLHRAVRDVVMTSVMTFGMTIEDVFFIRRARHPCSSTKVERSQLNRGTC